MTRRRREGKLGGPAARGGARRGELAPLLPAPDKPSRGDSVPTKDRPAASECLLSSRIALKNLSAGETTVSTSPEPRKFFGCEFFIDAGSAKRMILTEGSWFGHPSGKGGTSSSRWQ